MQLVLQSIRESRVFRPARLLLFCFRCSAIWPPRWDSGSVSAAWAAPASQPRSRRRPQWLLRRCPGRRPQVRGVAAAQAKPRGERPVRRRRRLERTEGLDRRSGSREGRSGEAPSRRADGITHAHRTNAAVRRLPSGRQMWELEKLGVCVLLGRPRWMAEQETTILGSIW